MFSDMATRIRILVKRSCWKEVEFWNRTWTINFTRFRCSLGQEKGLITCKQKMKLEGINGCKQFVSLKWPTVWKKKDPLVQFCKIP